MGRGTSKASEGGNLAKFSNEQLKATRANDIKVGDFLNGKAVNSSDEMARAQWNKDLGEGIKIKEAVYNDIKVTEVKVGSKTTKISGEYTNRGRIITVSKTFKNGDILQKRRK